MGIGEGKWVMGMEEGEEGAGDWKPLATLTFGRIKVSDTRAGQQSKSQNQTDCDLTKQSLTQDFILSTEFLGAR